MRVLAANELELVNGALLANIGIGIAGMMGGMATYSLSGSIDGQMSVAGFAGSAIGGFIYGASGFNPAAAIAAGVKSGLGEEDS